MNKKVLIICFFFPPSPGIGGRRSAKFAKYLAKKGDEIHVIQAANPFPDVSPWFKDIKEHPNIHRHELPLNYPVEFIIPPHNLWGKIRYRLYNVYFSLFYPSYNRYDYSFFWNKAFLKKASGLILEYGIKNVIVSGPPFYLAHKTVKLKELFPQLNIIIDFRDPWIGSPYYGMSDLTVKQQAHELKLINEVYTRADYFTGPNSFLLNKQKEFIDPKIGNGAKIQEIPHGFDPDEVGSYINRMSQDQTDKIKLVYGGQFYPGTQETLTAFNKTLSAIKISDPDIYNRLEIDFYTPEIKYQPYFKENESIVKFHEPIGNEIMEKIASSSFCLIFLADHNKDFRTTKFLEYSILCKPFIVLGDKGFVASFVEENKLGKAYDVNSMSGIKELFKQASQFINIEYNKAYDMTDYSFEKVTNSLRELLK